MSEIKTIYGVYNGFEDGGSGTSKSGKDWKKVKLKIKLDDERVNTFGAFIPLPEKCVQFNDLEPGVRYKISYKEDDYQIPGGDLVKLKTTIGLFPAEAIAEAGAVSTNVPQAVNSYTAFKEMYKQQFPAEKHSKYHFIITYLLQKKPALKDTFKELVAEYEKVDEPPKSAEDTLFEDI